MLRRLILVVLGGFIMTACGGIEPSSAPATATLQLPDPMVHIRFPADGAVIYAESIRISGLASVAEFQLELVDLDDTVIAESTISPVLPGGDWVITLDHGYASEPTEMLIRAVAPTGDFYDTTAIILAEPGYRPEGSFGSIIFPVDGAELGGDFIVVEGTASGVADNQFTITLTAADGALLDNRTVTVVNPYGIDEMPWIAELSTQLLLGPATITAYFTPADEPNPVTSTVDIIITMDAG